MSSYDGASSPSSSSSSSASCVTLNERQMPDSSRDHRHQRMDAPPLSLEESEEDSELDESEGSGAGWFEECLG